MGAFGPRFHIVTYTTKSANLMLRGVGISLYLTCLGLDAGAQFFETVFAMQGLIWLAIGFILTVVPVVVVGLYAMHIKKMDYPTVCGMLCGSMANSWRSITPMPLPMATNHRYRTQPCIPCACLARVIIAQKTFGTRTIFRISRKFLCFRET